MVPLGKKLRYIRKYVMGVSSEEFGKLFGVTKISVSRWENGIREPGIEVLLKIAELSKCSLDWLLKDKGIGPLGYPSYVFELLDLVKLGEAIKNIRKEKLKLSIYELAEKLGIDEIIFNKYEAGDMLIPYDLLKKLCKLANVSLSNILFSEFIDIGFDVLDKRIPVLGSIPAGEPIILEDSEVIDWIPVCDERLLKKKIFGLRVYGDSMSPVILDGDYVIVIPQNIADNHNIVVARLNDEVIIKEFVKEGDRILLKSFNPNYPPILISENDDFNILGIVYGIGLRKLK